MSSLSLIERQKLERELGMHSGYVLGFSNRTFEEFFREIVGVPIYDDFYLLGSGSKANRMRAFWSLATTNQIILLMTGLLDAWELYSDQQLPDSAEKLINQIVQRLEGRQADPQQKPPHKEQRIQLGHKKSELLYAQLIELSSVAPQARGFAFERFLRELFDAYGLSARSSFRLTGEQIDGSFVLNKETYLLEAKWENARTGAKDLHIFEGKLGQKASWSRGLFLSNSGFTEEGLIAFGRGKRIVCMDGFDLSEILRQRLSLVDVLEAKIRRAAETGRPYIPVREIFL